ncbi:hypothetical protein [Teredinibacter franksiae]
MDEPTNDLDAETLELLESILVEYTGTLLLVSHDRQFLDNVVTSTIAFEGAGAVREYVGGYDDWVRQGGVWPEQDGAQAKAQRDAVAQATAKPGSVKPQKAGKKLSYKLQRELEALPAELEKLEAKLEVLSKEVSDAAFYQQPQEKVNATLEKLSESEARLASRYERWEELEALQGL